VRPTRTLAFVAGVLHHRLERVGMDANGATGAMGAVSWEARPGTRLRASAARRIRFPTLRQLYDEDGGEPALKTETAVVVEAGITQSLPRSSAVDVTLFRTEARDFIQRVNPGGPFENHDRYRFQGVEVAARTRPASGLLFRIAYAYLDSEDRSPGAAGQPLQYTPRHRLRADAGWAVPFGLVADASFLYVAGQVVYARPGAEGTRDLPDYAVTGLRLSRLLPGTLVSVYAGVDNLFDVAYEEEYGAPQPTRVLYAGSSVRFGGERGR
jgi:outer membrane cobalamin receptor